MHIDWWTLALQAVNFLILVWLLSRFLYRPVKEIIDKRKQLAEQAFAEATRHQEEADAARQRFEADRASLAQERQELLKKLHEELEAERRTVLDQAKGKADGLLAAARAAVAEERAEALTDLRDQASALAVELAAGLLRKTGPEDSAPASLAALDKQLSELPTEERERLEKDLLPTAARLMVVTAAALSPEQQAQWSDRLASRLGQVDKTEFAVEPELLGGAELRFPHAVLSLTWARQLRQAQELLQSDNAAS